jgi:hypothetical protein
MKYILVKKNSWLKEYENKAFAISEIDNYFILKFRENEIPECFKSFKRYSAGDIKGALNDISNGISVTDEKVSKTKRLAIADNQTDDGKILYYKIHGFKTEIPAGESYTFRLQNPYSEAYFQGAEILVNIIGVSDFDVAIPTEQGDFVVEQYGYDVNMGEIIYQRESQYASRIPQGIIIRNTYTNDTDNTLEVGINFIMHEIREPE